MTDITDEEREYVRRLFGPKRPEPDLDEPDDMRRFVRHLFNDPTND